MFKHILVPMDLSGGHQRALRVALALAVAYRARVTLLHVIQQVADTEVSELRDFYRRLVQTSERKLDRAARPFARRGVPLSTEVRIGEPAAEILKAGARRPAGLIVMASHRLKSRRPAGGGGTTSYKGGLLCRCPILLVK